MADGANRVVAMGVGGLARCAQLYNVRSFPYSDRQSCCWVPVVPGLAGHAALCSRECNLGCSLTRA